MAQHITCGKGSAHLIMTKKKEREENKEEITGGRERKGGGRRRGRRRGKEGVRGERMRRGQYLSTSFKSMPSIFHFS